MGIWRVGLTSGSLRLRTVGASARRSGGRRSGTSTWMLCAARWKATRASMLRGRMGSARSMRRPWASSGCSPWPRLTRSAGASLPSASNTGRCWRRTVSICSRSGNASSPSASSVCSPVRIWRARGAARGNWRRSRTLHLRRRRLIWRGSCSSNRRRWVAWRRQRQSIRRRWKRFERRGRRWRRRWDSSGSVRHPRRGASRRWRRYSRRGVSKVPTCKRSLTARRAS
mmetsp:Transcript_49382/g.112495  ORF Transcript_49382/g.112495 Transcript_49382/m.112495 type:complete len:227 (-) Transcript_49382:479-1159(-)